VRDDSFLLLFNAHFEDITFRLPARRFGTRWEQVLATGRVEGERLVPGADLVVESRSIAVFRRA
jgi:glycogen operon protein